MRGIRRHTRVVGCFPDSESALMLVSVHTRQEMGHGQLHGQGGCHAPQSALSCVYFAKIGLWSSNRTIYEKVPCLLKEKESLRFVPYKTR